MITAYREKLTWFWNRLRCMSTPELIHRIRNKGVIWLQKAGVNTADSPPVADTSFFGRSWLVTAPDLNPNPYTSMAGEIMNGRLSMFGLEVEFSDPKSLWNRDPLSGNVAPAGFGRTLDYRDQALVGDIKYVWEPNRHLHLVTLAQAYALTGERAYLDPLVEHLASWLDECPYPLGPNWTSSLELGVRLINWSIVWHLVDGPNCPAFQDGRGSKILSTWLDSIYQHCHTLNLYWSRYSSANNHLIGEAAGLYIGALTWPCWPQSRRWAEVAKSILEQECEAQNFADGVNREQAISYQQFVLDFLLFAALAGRAEGDEFPQSYWQRLERMLEFMAAIRDVAGNVPMIGDADDGYVTRLDPTADFCPYASLLATGSVLFARPNLLGASDQHRDDKTIWLLGDSMAADNSTTSGREHANHFPEGGYYVLGSGLGGPDEVKCIVDAGPLGYLAIAAHGHADALSIILSVAGREILIDPGTYAYHTHKAWRDYFRGTSAHNTIRVDEMNQSKPGGNFMWLRKANARCEAWGQEAGSQRFSGSHDGYSRLPDPVIHRREIVLDPGANVLRIEDRLECRGQHLIERFWHFSENCEVVPVYNGICVTSGGTTCNFRFSHPGNYEIVSLRGSESPIAGWVSRRFDNKEPTTTVIEKTSINGESTLIAEIDIELNGRSQ